MPRCCTPQRIVHPADIEVSSAWHTVCCVGHEYRIFRPDQATASAEARMLAARHFDVELEEIVVMRAVPLEDDDQPLGWLVSVHLG